MKRLLIAALAAGLAVSAHADLVGTNGVDTVRLTDAPCPEKIAAQAPPYLRDKMRAAIADVAGTRYEACWALVAPGAVGLVYEDGDQGLVPFSDFKPAP
jgi:hypothetical protein